MDVSKKKTKGKNVVQLKPKSKCCVSKSRCTRCPIRMLKEGTLPDGYSVKKRKLAKVDKKNQEKYEKIVEDIAMKCSNMPAS